MAAARRGSASDRWGTLGGDAAGTPGLSDGRSDVYVTRHGSPTEPGAPMTLAIDAIDPAELPESSAAYTPGTVVSGAERLVFVSGQPPWASDTPVPEDFDAQCRLAWRNVDSVLTEVSLTLGNLAKVTVYLSDRRYREANSRIRAEVLGDHRPAITIIITDIYSEDWLLEIEGIGVA